MSLHIAEQVMIPMLAAALRPGMMVNGLGAVKDVRFFRESMPVVDTVAADYEKPTERMLWVADGKGHMGRLEVAGIVKDVEDSVYVPGETQYIIVRFGSPTNHAMIRTFECGWDDMVEVIAPTDWGIEKAEIMNG